LLGSISKNRALSQNYKKTCSIDSILIKPIGPVCCCCYSVFKDRTYLVFHKNEAAVQGRDRQINLLIQKRLVKNFFYRFLRLSQLLICSSEFVRQPRQTVAANYMIHGLPSSEKIIMIKKCVVRFYFRL